MIRQLFHMVDEMAPPLSFPARKQTPFNEADLFHPHPSIFPRSYLYVGLIMRKCTLSLSKKNQLYKLIMINLGPQFPQGKQNRAGDQFLSF